MVKRKMLAADETLALKTAENARKRGITVYKYLNSILEGALKVEEELGVNPSNALKEYTLYSKLRSSGLTFIPIDALIELLNHCTLNHNLWVHVGQRVGKILSVKSSVDLGFIENLINFIFKGVAEVSKYKSGEHVRIVCLGPYSSNSVVEALGYFIKGVLEALNTKCNVKVSKGLVVVECLSSI